MSDYILYLVGKLPESISETAFMIDYRFIVVCHKVDEGYDYTVVEFSRGPITITADGVYDDSSVTLPQALQEVLRAIAYNTCDYGTEIILLNYEKTASMVEHLKRCIDPHGLVQQTKLMREVAEANGIEVIPETVRPEDMVKISDIDFDKCQDFDIAALYPHGKDEEVIHR